MVVELSDCNVKYCHSRGAPDDLPHWRRVPGFPVFGVGQASEAGFPKIAEKVTKGDKLVWFNMRQEPVAYVGGQPVTPRKTPNPHDNIEIPGKVEDMDALEVRYIALFATIYNNRVLMHAGQVCEGAREQDVQRGQDSCLQ